MADVKHCTASPSNDFEGFLHIFYCRPVFVDSIRVSGKDILKIGETTQLIATTSPSDASDKTLSWLTDDGVLNLLCTSPSGTVLL